MIVLVRQKGVEESPVIIAMRKNMCCCFSDKMLGRASYYIPVIYDPGQNWMTQSVLSIVTHSNPNFGHENTIRKKGAAKHGTAVALNATNDRVDMSMDTSSVMFSLEMATLNKIGESSELNGAQDTCNANTLPYGWELHASSDGHPYYFHAASGRSTWEVPTS
jgi:hypothetical protein